MAGGCKTYNRLGSQLPCWVHRRVICWGLEPGFPPPFILHKYLFLTQTILLNLIKGLWVMIKSNAFQFSLLFYPFRKSDVLHSPKRKIFPSILIKWNSIFYSKLKFIIATDVVRSSLLAHYKGITSVNETIQWLFHNWTLFLKVSRAVILFSVLTKWKKL